MKFLKIDLLVTTELFSIIVSFTVKTFYTNRTLHSLNAMQNYKFYHFHELLSGKSRKSG